MFYESPVFFSTSLEQFHKVRKILEINNIKYRYHTISQDKGMVPGIGSFHFNYHALGVSAVYQIKVRKADYQKAMFLINKG